MTQKLIANSMQKEIATEKRFQSQKRMSNGLYLVLVSIVLFGAMLVVGLPLLGIVPRDNPTTNTVTFIGFLITLVTAAFHLRRIEEIQITSRFLEKRQALERQAFQEVNASLNTLNSKLTLVHSDFLTIPIKLGHYPPPVRDKVMKQFLEDRVYRCGPDLLDGKAAFMLSIEANEIAVIKFDHLQTYLLWRLDDLKAMIDSFQSAYGSTDFQILLSPEPANEFEKSSDKIVQEIQLIVMYLHDYRIELMNELLGSAFDKFVPRRQPLDPSYVLLTEIATPDRMRRALEEERDAILSNQTFSVRASRTFANIKM